MLPTIPNLPEYLEVHDGGFISIKDHRAGLHHLVRSYNEGCSAEEIAYQYPSLSLATIHKVIAYYLENRDAVTQYAAAHDSEMEAQATEHRRQAPTLAELKARLDLLEKSGSRVKAG